MCSLQLCCARCQSPFEAHECLVLKALSLQYACIYDHVLHKDAKCLVIYCHPYLVDAQCWCYHSTGYAVSFVQQLLTVYIFPFIHTLCTHTIHVHVHAHMHANSHMHTYTHAHALAHIHLRDPSIIWYRSRLEKTTLVHCKGISSYTDACT